jgi:hypothetical protein
VLRLGGNTSDLARPAGFDGPLPVLHPLYRDKARVQPYYDVTPEALDALAGFLDATGWKLIFGINMRAGSPELAMAVCPHGARPAGTAPAGHPARQRGEQLFQDATRTTRRPGTAWPRRSAARASPGRTAAPTRTGCSDFGREVPESVLLSRHYYREAAERGSLADILLHDDEFDREIATLARPRAAIRTASG